MMITAREVSYSLFGVWRLAHLDPSGMQYFDRTLTGFWRSFWAAAVIAPGYVILVALRLADRTIAADGIRIVLVELIAYVIGWTAFPLIAWYLVSALGKAERYLGYMVAYNWSNVLQLCIYLPVAALTGTDFVPEPLMQIIGLIVTAGVLYYQYYIARTALDADVFQAIALVVTDLMISILLDSVVTTLEMS